MEIYKKSLEECYQCHYIYLENIIYRTFILIIIIKFIMKTIMHCAKLITSYYNKFKNSILIYYNNITYIDHNYALLTLVGLVLFML